jgi:LuxR family maltose regulon positive regulatory protein
LVQAQAGQIDQLHLRASRWYQEKGFVIPAIDHALRGQAYDQAALLLEKVIEVIFINGQLATLQPWLEMLPENIKDQHSILWIFHCLVLLWSGKSPAGILPFPPEREARITQDGFTGEIHTVEALYAMLGTKTVEAESLARKALQEISLDCSLFRCIAADTLGMVRTIQSDIPGAMRAFEELVEIARRGNFTVFEISGLSHLAGLYLQLGRLGSAEIGYQQALELCNQKIGKFSPGRGNALLGLGEIAREKHNLELALQYFEETINLFTQLNETSLPIAYLSVARVKAAQGDWQAGQAYLDKARQTRKSPGMAHYYERLIDNLQARFWIVQGDLESAEQWANRRGLIAYPGDGKLESAGSISAGSEFVYADFLAVVYLNLAQHQPEAALEMIESLLSNASQMGFLRREIQLLALKAIAQDQKNDGGSAIQTLQSSLMLAESEGYQQVFLDGGEPLKKLLYRANTRGQASSYARRILKLFPQEGSPLETPVRKNLREDHYLETLSAREMEVLALIAEGLSNHEICSRLHISLSTVKGHTANIYGKLGVNSRTQAILEASHLGILPD